MRTSLILSAFIVAVLGVSSALAQTNVGVSYIRFCTINAGYSIADVVATARGFGWSEETSPGLVMIRNGIAAAEPVGDEQFDFILEATYPSYADMVEKRTALLQRRAATDGRQGLAGVATCTENVRIRNRRIVARSPGGLDSIQPETAMASTLCELNGATIEDAAALASGFAENLGVGVVPHSSVGVILKLKVTRLASNPAQVFAACAASTFSQARTRVSRKLSH
jgi:hypothetical protein